MRIGLLTFHRSWNNGALLQAYALRTVLENMGHEACFVDFHRGAIDTIWRNFFKRRPWTLVPAVVRQAKQERFRQKYLPRTAVCYRSDADFTAHPPDFDAYICGSDQVWNANKGFYPAFFLHFADETAARLAAYAPSFGDYRPGTAHDAEMARLLGRFHALSVREKEGRQIVSELTGRPAEHVLDPALLLDDYSPITSMPPDKGEYIGVYYLGMSAEKAALVEYVKARLQLPIISFGPAHPPNADSRRYGTGIEQWLGYMHNAHFVCTDSFHGTALSILLRRDFLTVPHPTRNERIACLLRRVHLPHRLFDVAQSLGENDRALAQIAYDEVHERLQELRQASLHYLSQALAD